MRKLPEHERAMFMYEIDGMYLSRIRRISDPVQNISNQFSSTSSYSTPQIHISNSPSSNDSLYYGPLHTTMDIYNQRHLNRASYAKVISTPQQSPTSRSSFSSPHNLSNQ